jgi:hypothetical protein
VRIIFPVCLFVLQQLLQRNTKSFVTGSHSSMSVLQTILLCMPVLFKQEEGRREKGKKKEISSNSARFFTKQLERKLLKAKRSVKSFILKRCTMIKRILHISSLNLRREVEVFSCFKFYISANPNHLAILH